MSEIARSLSAVKINVILDMMPYTERLSADGIPLKTALEFRYWRDSIPVVVWSAAPHVVFKPLLMKFSKNCEVGHTGKFGEKSVSLLIASL